MGGMKRYNPLKAPTSEEWLTMDEPERLCLVENYHRHLRAQLPNLTAHAIFHVIVENQAALGDEMPVRRTIGRLMEEGIDRHEAIHAVGSVMSEHMWKLARSIPADPLHAQPNASYYAALEKLTVESWRQAYE
jgi:hypothetical protein